MKIVLKTLCSSFALMLALSANQAQAQEAAEETTKPRAVLFKVHDIKPVINSDGIVTDCDFLVTFYNRTTESFRQAKIVLGWNDEVSSRYAFDDEKPASTPNTNNRNVRNQQPSMEISTTIDMPSLGSYQQTTVEGSVKTEKCFLLLDQLEFNVEVCNILGKNEAAQSNRRQRLNNTRNTSECASLFEYVDSKNPEYYDEFKNISYSEQERLTDGIKKQDTTEIEENYEKINSTLNKVTETLSEIK